MSIALQYSVSTGQGNSVNPTGAGQPGSNVVVAELVPMKGPNLITPKHQGRWDL